MRGMSIRESDWMPLRGIDQGRLSEARLQAHYAVQWLARAARAYVPPQRDDGHTNLGWDGALGGFTTHPLKDGAWLSLKITDLTLALHVGEGSAHVQSAPNRHRWYAAAGIWNGGVAGWFDGKPNRLGPAVRLCAFHRRRVVARRICCRRAAPRQPDA